MQKIISDVLPKKGNISATMWDKYQETNLTLQLMPRSRQTNLIKKRSEHKMQNLEKEKGK